MTTPFTLTATIARPVDDVYRFLADSTNTPVWYEAVEHVTKLSDRPVEEGTMYRMTRRLPQGRVDNLVEVSELEPGRRITLRSLDGPTPFTYRYTLEPDPDGRTHLMLEGTITGEGLEGPAALLAPLASHVFRSGMAKNLHSLKSTLEARRSSL